MTASFGSIPSWNDKGLLPPYLGDPRSIANRSPYQISLADLVSQFGYTKARRQILSGFLNFRAALHQVGLVQGFQWVNGSFVGDIMKIENREPRDIDVVTFFHLPEGYTQPDFYRVHSEIFDRARNKDLYAMDALFLVLDSNDLRYLANRFAYFNSLWSHTRQGEWKGYLALDLSTNDDTVAWTMLNGEIDEEAAQ